MQDELLHIRVYNTATRSTVRQRVLRTLCKTYIVQLLELSVGPTQVSKYLFVGIIVFSSPGSADDPTYWVSILLIVLREVNEARWPHTCSRPCAFEEKRKIEKKTRKKNPPDPKHTTKSTAARRPRPTRDRIRGNTSHALAHTLPLP